MVVVVVVVVIIMIIKFDIKMKFINQKMSLHVRKNLNFALFALMVAK